jgi:hypothetical protein
VFKWRGTGIFPEDERQKLAEIVVKAHRQGRRVRFWGQPDQPELWRTLNEAGVDLINTDRLADLRVFLTTGRSAGR